MRLRPGLYAIADLDALRGHDVMDFTRAVLAAGELSALQLRAKSATALDVVEIAVRMARECRAANVPFVMNDRVDLAVHVGADFVHVGQDDLHPDAVRAVAREIGVGLSTHDTEQFAAAVAAGVDYVAFGPVFPTRSKQQADPVVGIEGLIRCVEKLERREGGSIPIVAIGGIARENAEIVARAGATSGAVIQDLVSAGPLQWTERARELHTRLGAR